MGDGLAVHIQKLGHELEEIRLRALNNILSKLERELVSDEDLVLQNDLFPKLVNWFTFPSAPQKDVILQLILRLVKVNGAGGLLLRADPGLSILSTAAGLDPSLKDAFTQVSEVSTPLSLHSSGISGSSCPREDEGSAVEVYSDPRRRREEKEEDWAELPPPNLAPSDLHVLTAALKSLSESPLQGTRFVSTVMLHDFPPQVFLNHPSIVMALLDLVERNSEVGDTAIRCLSDLTLALHRQLNFHSDPNVVIFPFGDDSRQNALEFSDPGSGNSSDSLVRYSSASSLQHVPEEGKLSLVGYCGLMLERLTRRPVRICSLLPSLLSLLSMSAPPPVSMWSSIHPLASVIKKHLHGTMSNLTHALLSSKSEEPIVKLHVTMATYLLLKTTVPLEVCSTVVPQELQSALPQFLLDPALSLLYPTVHRLFADYVRAFKYVEGEKLYEEVQEVVASLESGAKFLKDYQNPVESNLSLEKCLKLVWQSLPGIEYHQQYEIVERFIHLCINKWEMSEGEMETAQKILVHMLGHIDSGTRLESYRVCSQVVDTLLGPRQALSTSNPLTSLRLILNFRVIIEITSHGLTSDSHQVRDYSENIILLIMKCKVLVSETGWRGVVSELSPALPLLQAFASKSTNLGRSVIQMLDPDVAFNLHLSKVQVVSGNTRLMLSKDSLVREEGCARLMFLLGLSSRYSQPSSLSAPDNPITPNQKLTGLYEVGSMVRVLELMVSPSVDEKVIKSALTQLSVMTEDPILLDTFLDQNGVAIVKDRLSIIIDSRDEEKRDQFGPVVSVLRNIAKQSTKLRHEFSQDYQLLTSVLKGVWIYRGDWRLERDLWQLVVLLVYAHFVLIAHDTVSFPHIIGQRNKLPFPPATHDKVSPYLVASVKERLLGDRRVSVLLGAHWAVGREGLATLVGTGKIPLTQPVSLPIPSQPLRDILLSHLPHNLASLLRALSSASSHSSALQALNQLSRYIILCPVALKDQKALEKIGWEESFSRFLATSPASGSDQQLLVGILRFLSVLIGYLPCQKKWICKLLKEPAQVLARPLTMISSEDSASLKKELCMEVLSLIEKCMDSINDGWEHTINSLVHCLSNSHTQQFYSLGILDALLRCLRVGGFAPWLLWRLLPAFHCSSPASCMGLTITRLTVICLNHLLSQVTNHKGWDREWVVAETKWLPYLLKSCDPILRAATLQLMSGLCIHQAATAKLLEITEEDIFLTSLNILVNPNEASLVRSHAAVLCTNITHHCPDENYITLCEENGLYSSTAALVGRFILCQSITVTQMRRLQCRNFNNSSIASASASTSPSTGGGMITKELVANTCNFLVNLLAIDSCIVTPEMHNQGVVNTLLRQMWTWSGEIRKSDIKLFSSVCKVLTYSIAIGNKDPFPSSLAYDCIVKVFWLLQKSSYCNKIGEEDCFIVWKEAIRLLSSLLGSMEEIPQIPAQVAHSLSICVGSRDPSLQSAALLCIPTLTSGLSQESSVEIVEAVLTEWEKGTISCSLRWAVGSVVGSSHAGTQAALGRSLVAILLQRLREAHVSLTVMTPDTPRTKKTNIVLSNLCVDVGVLTNLLAGSVEARDQCARAGLADALHKLWAWCLLDSALLTSILQALITFTANSPQAALTLVLTSTMVGVGQRKSPTSQSLLHCCTALLSKDIYPALLKRRVLELAANSCQAPECRVILSKSAMLGEFLKLYRSKKAIGIEELEAAWFEYLNIFTSFPEGQAVIFKNDGVFEQLMECTGINRAKAGAWSILRNLSMFQFNKARLIATKKFLNSLSDQLLDTGLSETEKRDIVLTVWSLSANSQRGKSALKAVGLDSRLQLASTGLHSTETQHLIQTTLSVLRP